MTLIKIAALLLLLYSIQICETADTFINTISDIQKSAVCSPFVDTCFVLDGSASVTASDFEKARTFVHMMTNALYSNTARLCLVLYGTDVETIYSLDNNLSKTEMLSIIDKLGYPKGSTNTGGAISRAVDLFKAVNRRTEVYREMIVITNGHSNYPQPGVQSSATNAKNNNINTLAFSVGTDVNKTQLVEIAYGIADNVLDVDSYVDIYLKSYTQLVDSNNKLKNESCLVPLTPFINTEFEDSLFSHDKRYYNYRVPAAGLSLTIKVKSGRISGYYLFTQTYPSSAISNGTFSGSTFIARTAETSGADIQVYIAIEGLESDNGFSILADFTQNVDLTVEPNTAGEDVVEAVVKKITSSEIFPKDNELLIRIAYVESRFGKDGNISGNIWNVDESALRETQDAAKHASLTVIFVKILAQFGINWRAVTKLDLLKPLYSGLGGRLFLHTLPEPIPGTINEQAVYWKKYYNKDSAQTAATFVADITEMQSSPVCLPFVDTCFVLDGSGSIGATDYAKAKHFVYSYTDAFYSNSSRFCLVLYSTDVETVYALDNHLSKAEMLSIIDKLHYPQQSTNTGGAITRAVDLFKAVNQRTGVSREMIVITDGYSNYPQKGVQPGPTNAKLNNITTLVFGVGSDINKTELTEIAYGISENVLDVDSYTQLVEFNYKLKKQTCLLPLTPYINTEFEDSLSQREKRYYNYKVPANGLSIAIKLKSGRIAGYYSFTERNPSSAVHDGTFSITIDIPHPTEKSGVDIQVYIAIEGLERDNDYTILAKNK